MACDRGCHVDLATRIDAYGSAKIHSKRVVRQPMLEFEVKNELRNVRCRNIRRIKSDCNSCRFIADIEFETCPRVKSCALPGEEHFSVSADVHAKADCPVPIRKRCAPKKKCGCKKCRR